MPPDPPLDQSWQPLAHGSPVLVTLCGTLARTDLPTLLVLLRTLWPETFPLHLVVKDADGTLTPQAVTAAVGPQVSVVILP